MPHIEFEARGQVARVDGDQAAVPSRKNAAIAAVSQPRAAEQALDAPLLEVLGDAGDEVGVKLLGALAAPYAPPALGPAGAFGQRGVGLAEHPDLAGMVEVLQYLVDLREVPLVGPLIQRAKVEAVTKFARVLIRIVLAQVQGIGRQVLPVTAALALLVEDGRAN